MNHICVIAFDNMFEGANFARRGTALEILTLMHEVFKLNDPPSWLNLKKSLTATSAECLYFMLYDSFENNKEKALNILKCLPPQLLGKF